MNDGTGYNEFPVGFLQTGTYCGGPTFHFFAIHTFATNFLKECDLSHTQLKTVL